VPGSLFDTCALAAAESVDSSALGGYELALRHDPCWYCGGTGGVLDHIVPKARGGANNWGNYAGLCLRCNSKKGIRSVLGVLGADLYRARWREVEAERAAWNALGGAEA
jgi:5-methylcytosine-specific restriction endonuclease McrA